MAADCAHAGPGKTIAAWGLGPIGLTALEAARTMGATRFIAIDRVPERLEIAIRCFGADVIDYGEQEAFVARVLELTRRRGPDACIDATGFRYTKTAHPKVDKTRRLETDSIDALSECIKAVRKGGRVVPIGDFFGYANHFPIGAVKEKGVTIQSSQIHIHKYWNTVMQAIREGKYDPTFTLTHKVPLERAPEMYALWDKKEGGVIKAPPATLSIPAWAGPGSFHRLAPVCRGSLMVFRSPTGQEHAPPRVDGGSDLEHGRSKQSNGKDDGRDEWGWAGLGVRQAIAGARRGGSRAKTRRMSSTTAGAGAARPACALVEVGLGAGRAKSSESLPRQRRMKQAPWPGERLR